MHAIKTMYIEASRLISLLFELKFDWSEIRLISGFKSLDSYYSFMTNMNIVYVFNEMDR